jgi:hypothetical protein
MEDGRWKMEDGRVGKGTAGRLAPLIDISPTMFQRNA